MRELSLFSGAGGGLLATHHLLGWEPVGYVEIDEYCQRVLRQRIEDGLLPLAPIFTDVREFVESGAAREYRGFADVVTGGFPCQDISVAGAGAGLDGSRSGLWFAMLQAIEEVRPQAVFAENSPLLRTRGLQVIAEGLAGLGYHSGWGVLGAGHLGAPHIRRRMWVRSVGDADSAGCEEQRRPESVPPELAPAQRPGSPCGVPDAVREPVRHVWERGGEQHEESQQALFGDDGDYWRVAWWDDDPSEGSAEPGVGRVADGVAHRVDRIRALGNGQVPAVAAAAWEVLKP